MRFVDELPSSLLIPGGDRIAFRDPAVLYHDGLFHLWMTMVETEDDDGVYMYLAHTSSADLRSWSPPEKLTARDRRRNHSSPGNVVRFDGRWRICFQSYCRENGEKYGNANSRIFFSDSDDLVRWTEPEPVLLHGELPLSEQGRMIDPYLVYDEDRALWFCFFKQNGISYSTSPDMRIWTYGGHMDGGENVSILRTADGWTMIHSPHNGLGVKTSKDLLHWTDTGRLLTFGQNEWEWAKGRLTAGCLLPFDDGLLMFFHGSGPQDESVDFDVHAGIGAAWSKDGENWQWK